MKGKTLCEVFGYLKPNSMKTGKRSIPLDSLSVSEDGVSVSIHTHRQTVVMSVVADGYGEYRLEGDVHDLITMVTSYIKNHESGELYRSNLERSRSTGVEEGK